MMALRISPSPDWLEDIEPAKWKNQDTRDRFASSNIQQSPTPSARRNQPASARKYPPSPRLRRAGQPCLKLRLASHSKVETKAARPARGATASGEERMPYGVKPGLSGLLGLLGPFGQTRQTKQ